MSKLKIFFIGLMFLFINQLAGQTFGIKGGINFANLLNKNDNFKLSEEYKARVGFNLGATFEMPISEPVFFETGLIISTKGFRYNYTNNNNEYKYKVRANYLDIPLHIKYQLHFKTLKPYVAVGPYLGFGISGKKITKVIGNGVSSESSDAVNWGNENGSDYKILDTGFDFGAGIEYGKFSFGAVYGLGLANICPHPQNNQKIKNRLFSVSIGYKFIK